MDAEIFEKRNELYTLMLKRFIEECEMDFQPALGQPPVKVEIKESSRVTPTESIVCTQLLFVDNILIYKVDWMAKTELEAVATSKERLIYYMMKYGLGQAYGWTFRLYADELTHKKERNIIYTK